MRDPQDAKTITECCACDGEIYDGEKFLITPDGEHVCDDFDCLIIACGAERVRAG